MKTDSNGLKQIQTELYLRTLRGFFFAPFAVMLFFSCGSPEQKQTEQTSQTKVDSVKPVSERVIQKEDFISVLKGINISNINQYIHPKNGLRIINSSGAMPNMTSTSQVDKNFPVDFSAVKEEELPKVNCDSKTFWTKGGCFSQQVNTFKDEKIWTYCGLSKKDEAKVEETVKTISYTIINTAMNARYYFSQIDGKWYLMFVDLRRPCQA